MERERRGKERDNLWTHFRLFLSDNNPYYCLKFEYFNFGLRFFFSLFCEFSAFNFVSTSIDVLAPSLQFRAHIFLTKNNNNNKTSHKM